ncbi:hypothetical protein CHU92_05755 [Flavobacterium cyanobacteriorum]|uniref:4'-phosphopantetheinyl transferase domain-containing protein n=1 Tax=Flavobacterium cyanobacteriorum TaxID=2022802 RepID=A0A255ZA31_9FLAO|nr:4'-phosphopantetheinyl transferase superfamily protein [Flavobacterium cyanobacteriorum]OYQ38292.1 hypothetical protein CHU92_05755 [Flavobacterium cyanobacteriorum]
MIGNDVVDIEQARLESDWRRRGFLEKLFTYSEREAITLHPEPETMVWLFWSMKEAVYKIWNRQTLKASYIPHLLECRIDTFDKNSVTGCVEYKKAIFYTQTMIKGNIIKSLAADDLLELAHIKEIAPDIIYKDSDGLPYIYDSGSKIPVSVSHHGRITQVVRL